MIVGIIKVWFSFVGRVLEVLAMEILLGVCMLIALIMR